MLVQAFDSVLDGSGIDGQIKVAQTQCFTDEHKRAEVDAVIVMRYRFWKQAERGKEQIVKIEERMVNLSISMRGLKR